MTTTFAKLRDGGWGVRGPAALVRPGAAVRIARRDGAVVIGTVAQVLSVRDGTALATLAADDDGDGSPDAPDRPTVADLPAVPGDRFTFSAGVMTACESDLRETASDGTFPWLGTVQTRYGPATGMLVRGRTRTVAFRMTGTETRDGDLVCWHFVPVDPADANGVTGLTVFND